MGVRPGRRRGRSDGCLTRGRKPKVADPESCSVAVTAAASGIKRLGDQVVRGRFDRGREPADRNGDVDRHRHPSGQRLDAGAQPTASEDHGQDAVGELPQLGHRTLGLRERR